VLWEQGLLSVREGGREQESALVLCQMLHAPSKQLGLICVFLCSHAEGSAEPGPGFRLQRLFVGLLPAQRTRPEAVKKFQPMNPTLHFLYKVGKSSVVMFPRASCVTLFL